VRLPSLAMCIQGLGGDLDLKTRVGDSFRKDIDYWMNRPLPEQALKYAQQDVQVLFELAKNT
jgi:hypothetical protein